MDIDGLETMGNMMAMIHHDAPLDYFAGWQTRIPPCGSRQKQRLMPKIQLIYSKPNCGESLTSLDFWVVSFRKSNIPMENPPFIYFDDFPIHIAHQLRGFRKKSWLVVGLCQLCPTEIVDDPSGSSQDDPTTKLWPILRGFDHQVDLSDWPTYLALIFGGLLGLLVGKPRHDLDLGRVTLDLAWGRGFSMLLHA